MVWKPNVPVQYIIIYFVLLLNHFFGFQLGIIDVSWSSFWVHNFHKVCLVFGYVISGTQFFKQGFKLSLVTLVFILKNNVQPLVVRYALMFPFSLLLTQRFVQGVICRNVVSLQNLQSLVKQFLCSLDLRRQLFVYQFMLLDTSIQRGYFGRFECGNLFHVRILIILKVFSELKVWCRLGFRVLPDYHELLIKVLSINALTLHTDYGSAFFTVDKFVWLSTLLMIAL